MDMHQKWSLCVEFGGVTAYQKLIEENYMPHMKKQKQLRLNVMSELASEIKRVLKLAKAPLHFFN